MVLLVTVINLRGVKESGAIFAVPTYFFLVMAFITVVVGLARYSGGQRWARGEIRRRRTGHGTRR